MQGGLLGRIRGRITTNWGALLMISSLAPSEQTTAVKEVFATNDVRTLVANHLGVSVGRVRDEAHFTNDLGADRLDHLELMMLGDAMRNLIGWCPETRQPIDLQLYVDDATLARIWSNAVRFRCPHCGVKHEMKVERLASRPLSLELPQTNGGCDAVLGLPG
jgi:hypothetical protein